ncbi:hypothetical protein C8Q80DRAFT_946827 [Daedaleopsis nitida]|nr:hypothetical protein C8Q80DRAFT_946827 [Daedaleopsis nitida]
MDYEGHRIDGVKAVKCHYVTYGTVAASSANVISHRIFATQMPLESAAIHVTDYSNSNLVLLRPCVVLCALIRCIRFAMPAPSSSEQPVLRKPSAGSSKPIHDPGPAPGVRVAGHPDNATVCASRISSAPLSMVSLGYIRRIRSAAAASRKLGGTESEGDDLYTDISLFRQAHRYTGTLGRKEKDLHRRGEERVKKPCRRRRPEVQ